jgi:uncharacterized BrkB/YihY/UPF0761 family membrane protein
MSEPDSGKGRLESARAAARTVPARLTAARGRHSSVDASFDLVERDRRLAASVLAGGIAYRLFFWLLPVALILGGALGFVSSESAEGLADSFGLTANAADAVGEAVQATGRGRWALLLIGVGTLLWTSSRSVIALRRVFALVWDVPQPRGGSPVKDALAFSAVCAVLLAIPATTAWLREISPGPGILLALAAVGAFFGIWLLVSTWLPHADVPVRALVPGALLVAVGAQIVHLFTVFYVAVKLERSSALYGGLGAAATFLFVLYVVGRLIVAAPMLNAELWRRRSGQASPG